MTIFPTTFKELEEWASGIAFELKSLSKGSVRVSSDSLINIMATQLPGKDEYYNSATLKLELENKSANKNPLLFGMTGHFIKFVSAIYPSIYSALVSDNNTYEQLNEYIETTYQTYHLTDEELTLVSNLLPQFDPERVDMAFNEIKEACCSKISNYQEFNRAVMSKAYSLYILDTIFCFFDTLEQFTKDNPEVIKKIYNSGGFEYFLNLCIIEFNNDEDHKFIFKATEFLKENSKTQCLFDVIVRARISGTESFLEDYNLPDEWNDYYYEDDEDGNAILGASISLSVPANSKEDQPAIILKALQDAKDLGIEGEASVELRVDEEDDCLLYTSPSPRD